MALKKFDPYRELLDLRRSFDRMFEDLPKWLSEAGEDSRLAAWAPAVDIVDTENAYLLKAELPGISPDDVEITVNDGMLTISGERKFEEEQKKENFIRIERSYGSFSRSFNLGQAIDADKIEAHYKNGVLEVVVPKAESAKPRKIKVKTK